VTAFEQQTGIKVSVRDDDEDTLANLIVVRITGGAHRLAGPHLSAGTVVTLRARGPAFAWPADQPS